METGEIVQDLVQISLCLRCLTYTPAQKLDFILVVLCLFFRDFKRNAVAKHLPSRT